MVKVHVWLPDAEHVGHAALTIGDVYVSFWPEGEANKKDLKIKRSHPGAFTNALLEDIENEGNRQPVTVELNGLDENSMLDYVNELVQSVPRFQLARNNCSNVVANCLIKGSGRVPTFVPNAGYYSRVGRFLGKGIWTPDQVLQFARDLKKS